MDGEGCSAGPVLDIRKLAFAEYLFTVVFFFSIWGDGWKAILSNA